MIEISLRGDFLFSFCDNKTRKCKVKLLNLRIIGLTFKFLDSWKTKN